MVSENSNIIPPITAASERLNISIRVLAERMQELNQRLQPVLANKEMPCGDAECINKTQNSELLKFIDDAVVRVDDQVRLIDTILVQLDI